MLRKDAFQLRVRHPCMELEKEIVSDMVAVLVHSQNPEGLLRVKTSSCTFQQAAPLLVPLNGGRFVEAVVLVVVMLVVVQNQTHNCRWSEVRKRFPQIQLVVKAN